MDVSDFVFEIWTRCRNCIQL